MTTADTPRLELAAPRLTFPRVLTRGAVAKAITEVAVRPMPIRMRYPDGTVVGAGGPDAPVLDVVRPRALFRRLEAHPVQLVLLEPAGPQHRGVLAVGGLVLEAGGEHQERFHAGHRRLNWTERAVVSVPG